MSRKLRGAFDFHDTISNPQERKERLSHTFFGEHIAAPLLKREWIKFFDKPEERYDRLLSYLMESWFFFRHVKPLGNAVLVIQKLEKDGIADLFMITSSGEKAFQTACRWCDQYRIFRRPMRKFSVDRDKGKKDLAELLKLDFFLDNEISALEQMIGTVPYLYLLTDDHNIGYAVPPGISRVDSIDEFDVRVRAIARGA